MTGRKQNESDKSATVDGAPVAPPCAMAIFGAAGDLTRRLVVPALYNLACAGRLPDAFRLVAFDLRGHGLSAAPTAQTA